MALFEQLAKGEFEHRMSTMQLTFYAMERQLGHWLYRKKPEKTNGPRLLNLGCGPLIYEGWINADDYGFKRSLRDKRFRPNWMLDIVRPWNCEDCFFDGIFTEHVIEHITYSEAVHVMKEALRTLKPSAWLRISVPGIECCLDSYQRIKKEGCSGGFPEAALRLSYLTQMHFHRSAWDADLMIRLLTEIGFVEVQERAFREGTDERLLKDGEPKRHESLYVEGQKPR